MESPALSPSPALDAKARAETSPACDTDHSEKISINGRPLPAEKIGGGGMGAVYGFDDPEHGKVAVKILVHAFPNEVERRRFEREFNVLKGLDHPNIVRVFKFDKVDARDHYYFMMELLAGASLDKCADLSHKEIAAIGHDLAEALDCVHAAGIVHRDIKPANVIYQRAPRRVTLVDFGICHVEGERVTGPGVQPGSKGFAAPEKEKTRQSDIFSLGRTLQHLLDGRADDSVEFRNLAFIAARCTREEPAERYASAAALKRAFDDCLAGKELFRNDPPPTDSHGRWQNLWRRLALGRRWEGLIAALKPYALDPRVLWFLIGLLVLTVAILAFR